MEAPYKVFAFLKGTFPVSQYYGENLEYYKQFGLAHGHEGVDFATPNGTEIYSPLNGIIVRDVVDDIDYGNAVVIWDPVQKCAVWFCHLQDVLVSPSEAVQAGQLLGHTNNTGNTTGPHVHVNFVETDENGYRTNMNNGEEGFLNLLDASLVDILPFPGLQLSDAQMPKPSVTEAETTPIVQSKDAATLPVTPSEPVVPPGGVALDAPTFTKLVSDATTNDVVCEFLGLPKDSDKTTVLAALTAMKVDLTSKINNLTQKYTSDLSHYQIMQAAGFSSLDDINNKLEGVKKDNVGLQKQLLQTTQSNATLAEQLKAKNEEDSTAIEMGMSAQSRVKDLEDMIRTIASAHGTKPTLTAILTAVATWQGKIESLLKQLHKKNISEDVHTSAASTGQVAPGHLSAGNALDFIANLFWDRRKVVS